MKVRFDVKWKEFKQGEVVNRDEFAEKMLAYLVKRGVAKKVGGAAKSKGKETAEKPPQAERAVTQVRKPEPAKPQPPKDADKKDAGQKE